MQSQGYILCISIIFHLREIRTRREGWKRKEAHFYSAIFFIYFSLDPPPPTHYHSSFCILCPCVKLMVGLVHKSRDEDPDPVIFRLPDPILFSLHPDPDHDSTCDNGYIIFILEQNIYQDQQIQP